MTIKKLRTFALATLMLAVSAVGVQASVNNGEPATELEKKIFKKIIGMPFYGIFDNIKFEVQDKTVVLSGYVYRPSNKSVAEKRVERLDGVDEVVNNIEILSPSRFDDNIRVRTFRSLARTGTLSRYMQGVNPSIRIIVNRGRVILEGYVQNETDKNLARIAANTVPGVFKVTNNLEISDGRKY